MRGILNAGRRALLWSGLAVVLGTGCGDESDPAYLAELLDDPVETETAIEKLRKMVDERLQLQDPKAQAAAMRDFAARANGQLVASFRRAAGNPLLRSRILSILTRSVAYDRNVGAVLEGVFFPILDDFKSRGEDPAQASLVVDTIAALAEVPEGMEAAPLGESQAADAARRFQEISKSVRATWMCQERIDRMKAANNPVADQEQLLLSCIQGVARLVAGAGGKAAAGSAATLLTDSIRESPFFQDFYLNRAACDSIDSTAESFTGEDAEKIAAALVEGLFMEGDFFLYPYARRALVHLASVSPENREIVARELVRALGVDMPGSIAGALGALGQAGVNENLRLLALPCGAELSVSCESNRTMLQRYLHEGLGPDKAACNARRDPDQPGSGFQWGFNYGVFWDKVGNILVDIVTPFAPGTDPTPSTNTGLLLDVMRRQLMETGEWADRVAADRKLLESIAGVYEKFMQPPRSPSAQPAEGEAARAGRARRPTISSDLKDLFERLTALRANAREKMGPQARQVVTDLVAALAKPDARSDDKEACEEILEGFFRDLQDELYGLADSDNDNIEMNLRLWRTVAAARTLSLLGVTGADHAILRELLEFTQFSLENLMGFRISAVRGFPQLLLRFRQRFTPEGMPMMGQPAIPALIGAIESYQQPLPEVLNFLLHMIAATALTGENQNATVVDERYIMLNADVATFRLLAARAFFTVFRADVPDAAAYLDLFKFYTKDVQYVLALEKTLQNDPAFRMYPPNVRPAPDAPPPTFEEPDVDWLHTRPERSADFHFGAYADRLANCVLRDVEDKGDAAKWRREMDDNEKTRYCMKWVDPWATEFASVMRREEIPRLTIPDWRCWNHMKNVHDDRFQYCLDKENNRTPEKELNLSDQECKDVKELDDTYYYCVELRFEPQYVEKGKPTLWGCYDRFPWLRSREPIGPACPHLSQRLLAAYLYVKFRDEAGVAASDGVTLRSLQDIMTIDEYLKFAKTFGMDQNEEMFAKVDRLTQQLAKVKLDFPRFVRPSSAADRESKTDNRRTSKTQAPPYVSQPWYWHDEWITREPVDFSDLRTDMLDWCRAEGDETGTECADDGGRVGHQMKITIEGGAPGPLMEKANSLAIMLMREDLVVLGEMRDAVVLVEENCATGGGYNLQCLSERALEGTGRDMTLLVNPSCRGMAAEALGCTPDPEWDPGPSNEPDPCTQKKNDFAKSMCSRFLTETAHARGFTDAEMNRRVRALYLLAALAGGNRSLAEETVGDMMIAIDSDARFLAPLTFAIQKIRPKCCPHGHEGDCDLLGCARVRLFAEYWRNQQTREGQVPDIDALYYMLLASM